MGGNRSLCKTSISGPQALWTTESKTVRLNTWGNLGLEQLGEAPTKSKKQVWVNGEGKEDMRDGGGVGVNLVEA